MSLGSPGVSASGFDDAHRAWTAHGDEAGASFGAAVARAGDVNGDGFPDVIVGAPNHSGAAGPGCGKVFVYYGSASGLSPEPSWSAEGEQAGSHFGQNVALVGDVNRDGFDDIVVSAPGYDFGAEAFQKDAGRVYVYLGSPAGLQQTPAFVADGPQYDLGYREGIGGALAFGDFNGDGYADVVAAQYARYVGGAHVYYGSAAGLSSDNSWFVMGLNLGKAVAVADVNQDGFDDLIVTSLDPDTESPPAAVVYFGSPTGLPYSPGSTGLPPGVPPSLTLDLWSNAVNVGDLDHHGFDDLLAVVGDPFGASGPDADLVPNHVLFRTSASGPVKANELGPVFGIPGSLTALGDVNGDGYPDALAREGDLFYLYFGSSRGFDPLANGMGTLPGTSVSAAGDVDRDTVDDVLVGDAPSESASLYRGARDWEFGVTADLAVQQTVAQDDPGFVFSDTLVTNLGPEPVRVRVVDFAPPVLSGAWGCFPTSFSSQAAGECVPTASGDLDAVVTLGPGGAIHYSLFGAGPISEPFINTSAVLLPNWVSDPDTSNNQATVVSGSTARVLFHDDFESGDVAAWSSRSARGLAVVPSAGLEGSWALQLTEPRAGSAFVRDELPSGQSEYHARFLLDPTAFGKAKDGQIARCRAILFSGHSGTTRSPRFELTLERGAAGLALRARAPSDKGTLWPSGVASIADGRHLIEVGWRRSSGPLANDGQLVLRLDGADAVSLVGLHNDAGGLVDSVELSLDRLSSCLPRSGEQSVRVDAFESWAPE